MQFCNREGIVPSVKITFKKNATLKGVFPRDFCSDASDVNGCPHMKCVRLYQHIHHLRSGEVLASYS